MPLEEPKRWYADWRVWVSMALLLVLWSVGCVVGLPFRVFDSLWQLLF